MRHHSFVTAILCVLLSAGVAAAMEIDGLPTMAWGAEPAVVMEGLDGEWIGPEPMPLWVQRWFAAREILGQPAEVSLLFYGDHLVGWTIVFDLDSVSDADAAQGSYERLSEGLTSRLTSQPDVRSWHEDEVTFAATTWAEPGVGLSLNLMTADGFQHLEMIATRPSWHPAVRAASIHLFVSAEESDDWLPPRDWGLSQDEVVGDDRRWEPGFLNSIRITSLRTARRVFGRPASTLVVFVDDQLVAWVSMLTVHGGLAERGQVVGEIRLEFEAELGEPTTETETGVFWESERDNFGLMWEHDIESAVVGLRAWSNASRDDVDWAIDMFEFGLVAPWLSGQTQGN